MPRPPTLRTGLLDLTVGIGIAGPALMVLYSYDRRPIWVTATVTSLLALAVVTWIAWRRSTQRSRAAAVVFAVLAAATMSFGDGFLFYGIVWAACLVLGVTFSSGAALWLYAAGLAALVLVLHLSAGSPVEAIYTEVVGAALVAGVAAAVSVVLRDSLRVGDALQSALVQLDSVNGELRRRLSADRDLTLAQERERTARDLHDDLGHRLTAIGLSLDYVTRVDNREAARAEIQRARALVGESLDAMRRLVRAMHPVELGSLRDAEAFHAVADAFRGTGIDISVSVEGDDHSLPHEQSLLLLRFVQEGLTNVVRHSAASAVDLQVRVGAGSVTAAIEDRGGRTPADGEVTEGFGIRSLRTRAEELGGALVADHTTTGFRLAVHLPTSEGWQSATVSAAGGRIA